MPAGDQELPNGGIEHLIGIEQLEDWIAELLRELGMEVDGDRQHDRVEMEEGWSF
ncbi:cell division protein [Sesbania bispinosa]|nr:cell division protein [Sesbania bispinosa]